MAGILHIVATPIGNLQDITARAIDTLKGADLILCEDTRNTKILLDRYCFNKPLLSYHQHSTISRLEQIAGLLKDGKNLALVSDAGTPGISDPGNKLVERLVELFGGEIKITPIPGPSAVITALSVCGFACDRFTFLGFPPAKKKRKKFFEKMLSCEYPTAIYESPYRIIKTLSEISDLNEDKKRRIVVCRELTKKFETISRGTVEGVVKTLRKETARGEYVIVLEGKR